MEDDAAEDERKAYVRVGESGIIYEISLIVHLDNENMSEVSIELYRYDGDNCLAVADGVPTALVARSGVVDLVEAVHAIVLN